MQNYGHIRFSTREQDENRQRIALVAIGVPAENAYLDKQSGKDFRRAAYQAMPRHLPKHGSLYGQEHRPPRAQLQ